MKRLTILPITALILSACTSNQTDFNSQSTAPKMDTLNKKAPIEFNYIAEQFADLRILRYEIPGFDG